MAQDTAPSVATPIVQQVTYTAVPLAPRGLGYGEGVISYEGYAANANAQELQIAITSPQILIAVDNSVDGQVLDDSCSDGRQVTYSQLPNRAKVFGGGATMLSAALIGLGQVQDVPLHEVFVKAQDQLRSLRIGYGAHADSHHTDPTACGCGAIDKAQVVLQNIVKFEPQIMGTLLALDINTGGIDDIMKAFRKYAEFSVTDATYNGRQTVTDIMNSGAAVEDFADDRREMCIVLNSVPGMTVNQEYIRTISEGKAQVFGVDVWRMQDLAQRSFPGDPVMAHKAFLSGLIYMLSVTATLTAGDLPVYAVNPA